MEPRKTETQSRAYQARELRDDHRGYWSAPVSSSLNRKAGRNRRALCPACVPGACPHNPGDCCSAFDLFLDPAREQRRRQVPAYFGLMRLRKGWPLSLSLSVRHNLSRRVTFRAQSALHYEGRSQLKWIKKRKPDDKSKHSSLLSSRGYCCVDAMQCINNRSKFQSETRSTNRGESYDHRRTHWRC